MKTLFDKILIVILVLLVSCGGEEENNNTPVVPDIKSQIQMTPSKVLITDLDTATFYLSLQNSSAITWRVINCPKWLLLSKTSGNIDKGIVELKGVVDKSYTKKGHVVGMLEVSTDNAGECHSRIEAYIGQYPDPYLPKSEIFIDSTKAFNSFTIINRGDAPLNATIIASDNWIITDGQISVPPNTEEKLGIYVNQGIWLPMGVLEGNVKLYYNNYKDSITVRVTANIEEITKLRANQYTLNFDFDDLHKNIEITNIGNSNYQWTFASDNPAVSCFPNSGNLKINEKIELQIDVDRNKCLSGYLNNFIYIIDPNNDTTLSIPIKINHYREDKLLIEGNVVDAIYNKATDRLICVIEQPNKLLIIDINDDSVEDIPLKVVPNCLSVTKNGKYAAVGHDAYISYINLSTKLETDFISVPYNIGNVVLAPNAWTYFVDNLNNHEYLGCIDANKDNIKTLKTTSSRESSIILHPSNQYIYTNTGSKYDIREDTLKFLYSYPRNQGYDWEGSGVIITSDKNTIVTNSGQIYKLSDKEAEDMTYIGKIYFEDDLEWLTYSSETNKFAGLENNYYLTMERNVSDIMTIHDATSYSKLESISLPYFGYLNAQQEYQLSRSASKYCFFNKYGTKIITLMHTTSIFPGKKIWGVYSAEL